MDHDFKAGDRIVFARKGGTIVEKLPVSTIHPNEYIVLIDGLTTPVSLGGFRLQLEPSPTSDNDQ